MDFSFCNSFSVFLPCTGRFGFGALGDSRNPAKSAKSLSFCSCGKLRVVCSAAITNASTGTLSGVTAYFGHFTVPYSDRLMVYASIYCSSFCLRAQTFC